LTKASLVISGAGNFLNVILDPILIFLCGLGISGAAIATVISEYVRNAVNLVLYVLFAHVL
jgi:Na+-driven multidrug efflux pump